MVVQVSNYDEQIEDRKRRHHMYKVAHLKAMISRVETTSLNVLLDANICKYLSADSVGHITDTILDELGKELQAGEDLHD